MKNKDIIIHSHILRNYKFDNWQSQVEGKWSYHKLYNDASYRIGWISFDAVTWNEDEGCLYCGMNAMDNDILYRFWPDQGRFESLNAQKHVDKFDVKIHRTLCRIDTLFPKVEKIANVMPAGRLPALTMDDKGTLYGGGGIKGDTQLFKWNPSDKAITLLEKIKDEHGNIPARIHEMAVDKKGKLFLAENDNHHRSSYLWTVEGF